MDELIAQAISKFEEEGEPVEVSLSNELVHLLSDQLYQSPLKAIEELVVNAYDAEATECRIFVPSPSNTKDNFILVFDNGIGMDKEGLVNLWQIGRSNKRNEEIERRSKRKQIGKFGIGKLATYTIANRLTHITRSDGKILSVTIDFDDFLASPSGPAKPIKVPVRVITDWDKFIQSSYLSKALQLAGIDFSYIKQKKTVSWTIALLEGLKTKAQKITESRLKWVLCTAMPLQDDFRLFLNCEEITSSKENYKKVVEFGVHELPKERLKDLNKSTGENWRFEGNSLKSETFKSGISGKIVVTEKMLLGKSDDIERSHGFFIKVRKRLVNENDPLFGLKPLVHGTFNRFRAEIQADDLDGGLKVSRETIEEAKIRDIFRVLLREIFREADQRYHVYQSTQDDLQKEKREGEKQIVAPWLVEHPIADALIVQKLDASGAEADDSWFYLHLDPETDLEELIQALYNSPRSRYKYQYAQRGPTSRLVYFDPKISTFWLNTDHDLVREYATQGLARVLLEDFVTAETLLEIYLRVNRVPPHIVGEILEQRDALLRSLTKDHTFSPDTISRALRDAAADEHELEIALVVAARAIGFVATHISGSGEPDGVARFADYPDGEKKIILEAKSSKEIPSLSAIDFAGLAEHVKRNKANGCLLVAPGYPGESKEDSAAASRAQDLHISCWTIDQLARFIEASEARQLNARNMLDIVLKYFSPNDVTEAINKLLAEPAWDNRELYREVIIALRQLEGRLKDQPRNTGMIGAEVSREEKFLGIQVSDIDVALSEMANSSQGGMTLRDQTVVIHVSIDELERKLSGLTKESGESRKRSNFRKT